MTNLVPFSLILSVGAAFILLGSWVVQMTLRVRAKAQQVVVHMVKSKESGNFREDGRAAV